MNDPSLTPSFVSGLNPDDLLVYAPGLQRLAARLVGVDLAEDLLQDTWVRALEKPPTAKQPLGPWLVRVLSNLAVSSYRRRSRRHDWECALHDSEQHLTRHASPDEIGAELEAAEKVMGAVSDLDELPRKIISLRYLRGMPSGKIGEALELPASTVRWHIQNSVAKMRVSLAHEGRDLSNGRSDDWVACLVPLLHMTDRAAVAKLGATAAASPLAFPVVLAAVLTALIGIIAQLLAIQDAPGSLGAPQVTALVQSAAPPQKSPRVNSGQRSRGLATPAAADSRRPASAEVATGARLPEEPTNSVPDHFADSHRQVHGLGSDDEEAKVQICSRIVGASQTPILGAELSWASALGRAAGGFAVSDSDGRISLPAVAMPGMVGPNHAVEVRAPGHASRLITWPSWIGRSVNFGDLDLTRSRPLSGFVADADGDPIVGASVTATTIHGRGESRPVETDGKGRFKLEEVSRTSARILVQMEGFQSAAIHPADDFDGQLRLILQPDDAAPTLALLIVDPTNLPVPDAVVSLRREGHTPATFVADHSGQIRVPLSVSPGAARASQAVGDVTAFDPAFAYAPTRLDSLPLDGQQRILTLDRGRVLRFRVRNPSGAQPRSFRWFHPESIYHPSPTVRHGEVVGSAELVIAVAEGERTLQSAAGIVVLADGFAPVSYDFRRANSDSLPIELLLRPEGTVEVHVTHRGSPVKNALVTVTPTDGGPLAYGQASFAKAGEDRNYRTDSRGAFEIPQHAYFPFSLRVKAAGLAPWFHHHLGTGTPFDLKPIQLDAGGTLVVQTPTVHASVAGSTLPLRRSLEATHESGCVTQISLGTSPFHQMHGLRPGRWTVRWLEPGPIGGPIDGPKGEHGTPRAFDIAAGDVCYVRN